MAVFLMIRQGRNDLVGRAITGRRSGVHLNAAGREQARQLAVRLSRLEFAALYSSPMERAVETAEPLAQLTGLPVQIREGISEVDFGDWSGLTLTQLADLPAWRRFNTFRSGQRIPGGEMMAEVQARMVGEIEQMHVAHPQGNVAVVSHGDPIKTVLAHYLGFPLDFLLRMEIGLASVTALQLSGDHARLLYLNHTSESPGF